MALTSNNLEMIRAIAQNDMHAARKAALASLAEDKSKKNAWAADRFRKRLAANASVIAANMPPGLNAFLTGESPGSFHPEQYFIRENENAVYQTARRMKLTSEMLGEKGIRYSNTVLLYGKTGTGKTTLGRYIAFKMGLPFFYISFSNAIDSYMGSTARNIAKVFDFCSSIPCILMLDEVDCISMKRSSGGNKGPDGELERTTISLMQEIDRLPGHVVLLAATNRPDLIDDALMRRFSVKCELLPMTKEELTVMAKKFLLATDTEKYISNEQIERLAGSCDTPGSMMPDLIRMIGDRMYEENKVVLEEAAREKEEEKFGLWQVTYTWQANIPAETEADAVAIAKSRRQSGMYGIKDHTEGYAAKRAKYILPEQ